MPKSKMLLRLQKVIADCGVTSRRKAEELIVQGRVKVNNEVVTTMGEKVDPLNDIVEVDGNIIDLLAVQKFYLVLNKPRGYVTTVSDPEGRKTVMDLCQGINARLFPVGRLDYLSEGLLILTNDGDVANTIMHPRYEVTKIYEVKVFGIVNEALLAKLKKGITDSGEKLKPLSVRVLKKLDNKTWLEFRLNEGKNREIRRICEAFNLTVDKLRRVAIENLSIEGISPGDYRFYSKEQLLNALNLKEDGSKKRVENKSFYSSKKTLRLKDKKLDISKTTFADNPKFQKYRKDKYNETMKLYKEIATNETKEEGVADKKKKKALTSSDGGVKKKQFKKKTSTSSDSGAKKKQFKKKAVSAGAEGRTSKKFSKKSVGRNSQVRKKTTRKTSVKREKR